jgi:hypothetical protein
MKQIKLFFLVCLITGICIFLFSIIGPKFIKPNGVFVGAIIGGVIGIFISIKIAVVLLLIQKDSFYTVLFLCLLCFIPAILIATSNLNNPVLVVGSTALIGFGAVIGVLIKSKRKIRF